MKVGVLALQGGFAAHVAALRECGHEPIEVRTAADLDGTGGLVLPGGESTAMRHLLDADLERALRALHASGKPILATCAGLILASRQVRDPPARSLGWLDVAVARNGWGRQLASKVEKADDGTEVVLIRAPRIVDTGRTEVLLRLRGEPILVRDGHVVGATFHPELAPSRAIHDLAFG
jgi:5'-phosphate synthase pdxT subunit